MLRRVVDAHRASTQRSELERRFKELLQTAADIPSPFFNALVDGETGTHEVDAYWPTQRLGSKSTASSSTAPAATASATRRAMLTSSSRDTASFGSPGMTRPSMTNGRCAGFASPSAGASLNAVARGDDIHTLPEDLPPPEDDGAADHLLNAAIPQVPLRATTGDFIRLADLPGRDILFCYPRTGRPDEELPPGWNAIPGARGCTPEACGFRDAHARFAGLGVRVLALSTQSPDYQREMAERLHLPFPVLSDETLELTNALRLPTFATSGWILLRRLTLVIDDGRISHVFYPVFPPDSHAAEVLDWLRFEQARLRDH